LGAGKGKCTIFLCRGAAADAKWDDQGKMAGKRKRSEFRLGELEIAMRVSQVKDLSRLKTKKKSLSQAEVGCNIGWYMNATGGGNWKTVHVCSKGRGVRGENQQAIVERLPSSAEERTHKGALLLGKRGGRRGGALNSKNKSTEARKVTIHHVYNRFFREHIQTELQSLRKEREIERRKGFGGGRTTFL